MLAPCCRETGPGTAAALVALGCIASPGEDVSLFGTPDFLQVLKGT